MYLELLPSWIWFAVVDGAAWLDACLSNPAGALSVMSGLLFGLRLL